MTQFRTPVSRETRTEILAVLVDVLEKVLDQYGLDDSEITEDTTFHDDLGLESIDLVAVGQMLAEHYGEQVNLAAFLAEKDLDDVIGITVGDLVSFVESSTSGSGAESDTAGH
ncbi:acyl carrier protein [Actinokineospora sp. PR83]|uniref:acyl carrier protein n=1 Tax=Actinokineospora sp. PR83 TaxID=2884908 RepID=UPI0027E147C8|nr:acyl carrier protein [Actinokineospora sp. PR83]MCG8919372.1 acyl carrier protein [Actinokineospora sp. PR83]